jgi:hypothetical protein
MLKKALADEFHVWMFALVSSECKIGSLLLTLDMNVVDVD